MSRRIRIFLYATAICFVQPMALPALGSAQAEDSGSWNIEERSGAQVPAFLVGSWGSLASGEISFKSFESLAPPDIAVVLGLSTVYGPEQAGWFLHAGKRVHLQAPDGVVYS